MRRGYCFLCGDHVELEPNERIVLFDEDDPKSGMCPAHAEEMDHIGKVLAAEDELRRTGSREAKMRLLELKLRELPEDVQEGFRRGPRELELAARQSMAKVDVNSDAYRAGREAGGRVDLSGLEEVMRWRR